MAVSGWSYVIFGCTGARSRGDKSDRLPPFISNSSYKQVHQLWQALRSYKCTALGSVLRHDTSCQCVQWGITIMRHWGTCSMPHPMAYWASCMTYCIEVKDTTMYTMQQAWRLVHCDVRNMMDCNGGASLLHAVMHFGAVPARAVQRGRVCCVRRACRCSL